MKNKLSRRTWIVIAIIFNLIPTLGGIFIWSYGIMASTVPCTPATSWNFFWICVIGTNVMLSILGGIVLAIVIDIFLFKKIFPQN